MKRIKTYITIAMVWSSLTGVFAQQGVIQGRVFNSNNNEPVEFATVAILWNLHRFHQ